MYDDELRRLLPDGADVFDAHLHLGHDIDGMVGDYDSLESLMARYGISRAFMFCLVGVPMIMGAVVRQILALTQAKYGPDSDFTSIARLSEEWAGVEIRG